MWEMSGVGDELEVLERMGGLVLCLVGVDIDDDRRYIQMICIRPLSDFVMGIPGLLKAANSPSSRLCD